MGKTALFFLPFLALASVASAQEFEMTGKQDTTSATLEAKTSLEIKDVMKRFDKGFIAALEGTYLVRQAQEYGHESVKPKVLSESAQSKMMETTRLIRIRSSVPNILPDSLFVINQKYLECKVDACQPSLVIQVQGPVASQKRVSEEEFAVQGTALNPGELFNAYKWNFVVTPEASGSKYKTKVTTQMVLNGAVFTTYAKQLAKAKKLNADQQPDHSDVKKGFLRIARVLMTELASPKVPSWEANKGAQQASVQ